MRIRNCALWGRFLAALCCLTLLCGLLTVACGEDYFLLDVDILDMDSLNSNDYVAQHLSASTQGVRIKKYISGSSELAESVRLTLMQMDTQTLVFDKDYGYQDNVFDSGVIYLPFVDNRAIPYLITLYVGDMVYALPFIQLQPRLSYNGACTYGVRLRDLGGLSSDWLMGTMLDLNELRATGYTALDICASNAYVIGQAAVSMQNDALMVQLNLNASANVEIHALSLYVIADCTALTGDPAVMGYPAAGLGEWVNVSGSASALLYMPMQVSYDPVGLSSFGYDLTDGYLQSQLNLWTTNCSGAAMEAPLPADPWLEATPDPWLEATPDPWLEATPDPWLEATPDPWLEATPDPWLEPAPLPDSTPEWQPPEALPQETIDFQNEAAPASPSELNG